MKAETLDNLFNPKTIAVVGATNNKGRVGYSLMKNLIGSGYEGIVYPINPKRKSIQGVKAYPSVREAPDKIDLAVIATSAKTVLPIVEECGLAGVSGIVVISSGFKEAGKEGQQMCKKLLLTAKKYGMRVVGPNCLGFIKPSINLNASFAKKMALPGKIAFISQSGALGTAILDWATEHNVGFNYFVSVGSMIDVGFHDLIDYFGNDPDTTSILIYMESLTNARKFLSAARAFSRTKPIIILKAGRSLEGAKAAMSHTGSITGNNEVFDAAFKRAGIIRVENIGELFDCAQTLAMQPRPSGNRLAIITNAGGPGVIATDTLIKRGGKLAKLSADTIKKLNSSLPPNWSKSNPVDVLGDAGPLQYRKATEACINDPSVDGLLVILTPQAMTNPTAIAKETISLSNRYNKTILASWMGEGEVKGGVNILKNANIPVYDIPEDAVKCFVHMHEYSRNLALLYETPGTIPHAFFPKTKANRLLINRVINEGRSSMTESEAKKLLKNYGIPVAKNYCADTQKEASEIALKIGFPVVMKVHSPDILHKSDLGGVKINIDSEEGAKKAFRDIMKSVRQKAPDANIHGVLIEPMISKKHELLIGCKKDPIFGPAIVFGMGGIAVEVFKDINVGLPPLNMALSMRLIEGTKVYKLLKGYRGMPGVDIKAIQFLLYKFSYLVADFPEISEIDINPFAVDELGGIVLDAKVLLDKKATVTGFKPYSHLVISPYPKEYVTKYRLKTGKMLTLRPIKPEDEPLVAQLITKLSKQTQQFRFFTLLKDITHELLTRYTQIDYDREIAIVAEMEAKKGKEIIGVVRLIEDPYADSAEFAIVVGDPWHGQGLGNKFTDYILDIARERGVKTIYAKVLKSNHIMMHMFENRGFKRWTEDNDILRYELSI